MIVKRGNDNAENISNKLYNRFKSPEELSHVNVPLNIRRLDKVADIDSAMEAVRLYIEEQKILN